MAKPNLPSRMAPSLRLEKKDPEGHAFLVSKDKYKDFELRAEFWVSNDANSGIFIRCEDPAKPGAKTCYECNIYDARPDPSYGTGAIVYHAEVNPCPRPAANGTPWRSPRRGRDLTVSINGQKTAQTRSGLHTEGPIALQFGEGTVKFPQGRDQTAVIVGRRGKALVRYSSRASDPCTLLNVLGCAGDGLTRP